MTDLSKRQQADLEDFDRNLFEHLKSAIQRGDVLVLTEFDHLNKRGAPSFSSFDNILPLLASVLLATGVLFINLLAGVAALVGAALFYTFAIRPWIAYRLNLRTRDLLLTDLQSWRRVWAYGGVVIMLAGKQRVGCKAPAADWRGLARLFVPESKAGFKPSGSSLMPTNITD
ncbi:hypothetical protein IHV25_04185 [Phaeovibrio sulfidiphilus]|uniref:Uncharacterized protein n=1 Tax=Phaeovibrio sulfidiphilus TaxID=1220600 RepID=A0A8J6YIG1_9PROT|nr:hypothetical protein [Phaeovibrio sulfidiphilus]MBE1236846.1 hypothetical protein [Phaeovibrio sulfidiphilus]